MQDIIQEVIQLIHKTGDRCIVVNPTTKTSFVLMSLRDYQGLVSRGQDVRNLTEIELLDKINQDIALWRMQQTEMENTELAAAEEVAEISEIPANDAELQNENKEEEKFYFEPTG